MTQITGRVAHNAPLTINIIYYKSFINSVPRKFDNVTPYEIIFKAIPGIFDV